MSSVNKVILIGNLGADPEVRYTPSGAAVCTISLATTRNWKNRETQERQEETEWHRVVFYDRLAEVAGEYLAKGRPVYVEGRLKTRKWQDKEGVDRYTTEVIAEQMQLLGSRDGGGGERGSERGADRGGNRGEQRERSAGRAEGRGGYGDRSRAPAPAPRSGGGGRSAPPARSSTGFDDMDDDIPF